MDTVMQDDEPCTLKDNVQMLKGIIDSEGFKRSPVDINIVRAKVIQLPPLCFCNYEKMPKKMKLTNSGTTAILSAKWWTERPYIKGGSLIGKYVFSQIHFHWGATAMDGSEHTIEGASKPLEMHVVHFKAKYEDHEKSLKHKDGLVTLVYLFDMTSKDNPNLEKIVNKLIYIQIYDTITPVDLFCLNEIVYPFSVDYFVYVGDVENTALQTNYRLTWIIPRDITLISIEQLKKFRLLLDPTLRPIRRNYRDIIVTEHAALDEFALFHVHPGNPITNSTMSPIPLSFDGSVCANAHEESEEEEDEL